jgi:hypothetical protein
MLVMVAGTGLSVEHDIKIFQRDIPGMENGY